MRIHGIWIFVIITSILLTDGKSTERNYKKFQPEYVGNTNIRRRCQLCNLGSLDEILVCGTDGNTYFSECLLRVTACMEADDTLHVRHQGKCRTSSRFTVSSTEESLEDSHLKEQNSESRQRQRIRPNKNRYNDSDSNSRIDDTEHDSSEGLHTLPTTISSHIDKDMNDPGTICPQHCPYDSGLEVCGSDGVTYISACFLEWAACQPNETSALRLEYRGRCKHIVLPTAMSEETPKYSRDAIIAEQGDPECCPLTLYEPVCARADDRAITVRSKCVIECMFMHHSLAIDIIKDGNCDNRHALQGLQAYPLTCENMIEYDVNDPSTYAQHISQLMQLYDDYTPTKQKGTHTNCPVGSTARRQYGRLCKFKQRQFGDWCTPANMFGYSSGQPCIMLQLTKVSNWLPVNYKKAPSKLTGVHQQDHISVTCREIIDRKRRLNTTEVFPESGFGYQYFPYVETEPWPYHRRYLSPAVLVKIVPRKLNFNFRIECRAWAKNINYSTAIYANQYQAKAIISFSITNNSIPIHYSVTTNKLDIAPSCGS